MVHSFFRRIFSLVTPSALSTENNQMANSTHVAKTRTDVPFQKGSMDKELTSVVVTDTGQVSESSEPLCEEQVRNNNNVLPLDENTRWLPEIKTSTTTWTWTGVSKRDDDDKEGACTRSSTMRSSSRLWISCGVTSVILLTFVTVLVLVLSPMQTKDSDSGHSDSVIGHSGSEVATFGSTSTSTPTTMVSSTSTSTSTSTARFYRRNNKAGLNNNNNRDKPTGGSHLDLKQVSRMSWDRLNSNQALTAARISSDRSSVNTNNFDDISAGLSLGDHEEVILPAKMVYTSTGSLPVSRRRASIPNAGDNDAYDNNIGAAHSDLGGAAPISHQSVNDSDNNADALDTSSDDASTRGANKNKNRSCCRTQKYSQVIKRDGCEPVTIVNRMCFGQCVSVWVPGLFASFPVCRPSRSDWKTVSLVCGKNRDKRKRVQIERVRRCSCMEIEPTPATR